MKTQTLETTEKLRGAETSSSKSVEVHLETCSMSHLPASCVFSQKARGQPQQVQDNLFEAHIPYCDTLKCFLMHSNVIHQISPKVRERSKLENMMESICAKFVCGVTNRLSSLIPGKHLPAAGRCTALRCLRCHCLGRLPVRQCALDAVPPRWPSRNGNGSSNADPQGRALGEKSPN